MNTICKLVFLSITFSIIACGGSGGGGISQPPTNNAPSANAGTSQSISTNTSVTLDGSASSDMDGDAISFDWSLASVPTGSAAVLSSADTSMPTFTPDIDGTYTASLIVNDGSANSIASTVIITATTVASNNAPTANAGASQSIVTNTVVTLDGSASNDVDGDTLSFDWSLASVPAGSAAVLSSTDTSMPTFTPDIDGNYTVSLTVSDGNINSIASTATITASAATSIANCPRTLPVVTTGTCNITAGTGSAMLVQGNLVFPAGIQNAAEVLIVDGKIACTGCDCSTETAAANATVLACTDAVVSPGLINARISSTFSFNPPFTTSERFEQRHDWRRGIRGHNQLFTSITGSSSNENVKWEEIRAVMAGSTSGSTSGGVVGMLRNLDRSSNSGFMLPTTSPDTFPLGDSVGTQLSADCTYPDVTSPSDIQGNVATVMDVAQGVDAVARNEFLCLSGVGVGSENTLGSSLAIAGGSGLSMRDINATVAAGTGLVWLPRSDTSLYGNTAQLPVFKRANAKIALGTHWSPSGSANIARELNCAAQWNDTWGGDIFTDNELVEMVTISSAELTGYGAVLGSLEVGKAADITIWNTLNNSGHAAIIESTNSDVALVMRSGVALFGEADMVQSLVPDDNCELLSMCGDAKRLCAQREFGETLSTIQARAPTDAYPLFSCSPWPNEPSCTPERTVPDAYTGISSPSDSDGDGVATASDNCPDMFNPPTPLTLSLQADSDNDGIGDLCDPVDNP